ncbi:ATP-binding protein [Planobispora takensis]|uniref:ATP-binding protein n=1 Tax=Planobispora takensis TaxID=1367882 RepID=UPI001EF21366|nr:ATP-binding protein [Planobispora takensis]
MDAARDSWLRILRATGLLDVSETYSLDRLTRLAARLTGAAAASVALDDRDRQVIVSVAGPEGPLPVQRGTHVASALCRRVIDTAAPVVLDDTRWHHQAVHGLEVRAYAGFPLRAADGEVLGSMSVIDTEPRPWSARELEEIGDLATAVETELRLRLAHGRSLIAATRMRAILDHTPEALVSIDADGTVTGWNAASARLFGWSAEEALGRDLAELVVSRRSRHLYYQSLRRVRSAGRPAEAGNRTELIAVDRDGRELPVEMSLQVNAEYGEPVFHAFLYDLSARRRAETLREAQHAVTRALANAGSAEHSATGTVSAVAETLGWACGEYWRVDPDENGITRVYSWTRPDLDLSAFVEGEPATLRPGEGLPGAAWASGHDIWISDLSGDPRDFLHRGAALKEGLRTAIGLPVRSGRHVLGVLTFYDQAVQEPDDDLVAMLDGVGAHLGRYKERRRAEELSLALAASQRHLDRIVSQLNDFVWTFEVGDDRTLQTVYTSHPESSGVFGILASHDAEVIMETVARHIHPDDLPAFTAYRETLAAGMAAEFECRITGLDGELHWVWTRAVPRHQDGRLFIDGISTDVTERHQLVDERERLLAQEQQQVRRLQDLDRMKDELVAVVSHELRSPIGAIRGYAEMLMDDPGLAGEHRAFVDVIDRKSAHLQRLVDDLLDLARFDAGHIGLDIRPLSLEQLVRQALDEHRPAAAAKRIVLDAALAPGLTVHADPVRLRQVLDNLLSNAIRYTPEDGVVTVTSGEEDDCATVIVADTGIGIPAEQYPRLFDRFFRASTALESGVKGTGLGLAITKAIVDAHGGVIEACPGRERGTVFTVRLPATAAAKD